MKKYYFTFGMKHFAVSGSRIGKSLGRYYTTIQADDIMTARSLMFARYGDQWAGCYTQDQFDECIKKYHLEEYEVLIQESKPAEILKSI